MIKPETELERQLLSDKIIIDGLNWGFPRSGHPEGKVEVHVEQILKLIDDYEYQSDKRKTLRILAITHDSFKKDAKFTSKNHGELARDYLIKYLIDSDLLTMIELHDKPYSIWRTFYNDGKFRQKAFETMLDRIKNIQLFLEFVRLDMSVKGKNSEPLLWFEQKLKEYGKVSNNA